MGNLHYYKKFSAVYTDQNGNSFEWDGPVMSSRSSPITKDDISRVYWYNKDNQYAKEKEYLNKNWYNNDKRYNIYRYTNYDNFTFNIKETDKWYKKFLKRGTNFLTRHTLKHALKPIPKIGDLAYKSGSFLIAEPLYSAKRSIDAILDFAHAPFKGYNYTGSKNQAVSGALNIANTISNAAAPTGYGIIARTIGKTINGAFGTAWNVLKSPFSSVARTNLKSTGKSVSKLLSRNVSSFIKPSVKGTLNTIIDPFRFIGKQTMLTPVRNKTLADLDYNFKLLRDNYTTKDGKFDINTFNEDYQHMLNKQDQLYDKGWSIKNVYRNAMDTLDNMPGVTAASLYEKMYGSTDTEYNIDNRFVDFDRFGNFSNLNPDILRLNVISGNILNIVKGFKNIGISPNNRKKQLKLDDPIMDTHINDMLNSDNTLYEVKKHPELYPGINTQ